VKVFIGSDHRGFSLKKKLVECLEKNGYEVIDLGTDDKTVSCDYPKIAYKVATSVAKSKVNRGILICMSGIGQSIAANKVCGAYAALCYNAGSAVLSRQHNNSNILVLGAKTVSEINAKKIAKLWLSTEFEGGRHQRRINQIKKIEKGLKVK